MISFVISDWTIALLPTVANIESFIAVLDSVEKKNSLLTDIIDADYLETLYREKFMVGKINEKIYINKW